MPGYANPQNLNRYSYVLNDPLRYVDPTGHIACNNMNEGGTCEDTKGDRKLNRLFDYLDRKIMKKKGGRQKESLTALQAMEMVVHQAALIYGNDWDGFLNATTLVFTGVYTHGAGTMWNAHHNGVTGLIDGGSGFHPDFRDVDGSQQVRHFWAGLATAANPNDDNPFGAQFAHAGNNYHDYLQDTVAGDDGVTIMDYKLTVTAIDIALQVGNQIETPAGLAAVLHSRLDVNGSGYTGPPVNPTGWYTPYD